MEKYRLLVTEKYFATFATALDTVSLYIQAITKITG